MDIDKRFEKTRRLWTPTNCIGSALYYSGKADKDTMCYSDHFYRRYFSDLKEVSRFKRGDLVAWELFKKEHLLESFTIWSKIEDDERFLVHLGVVSCVDPLILVHRPGAWVEFDESNADARRDYFDSVNNEYKAESSGVSFYR